MTPNAKTRWSVDEQDIVSAVAELKSFAAFDRWMDDQLTALVDRWIHSAAPNANRYELAQRHFGRRTQI